MKPTDKAILGMVSESPGRNISEPSGGLDRKLKSGGRALCCGAKAAWQAADWPTRRATPAGWLGAARWQGHVQQLEKPSSSHREISGADRSYNRRPREIDWRRDGDG